MTNAAGLICSPAVPRNHGDECAEETLPRLIRMPPHDESPERATSAAGMHVASLGEAQPGGGWSVWCGGRQLVVRKALSCLLQPMTGDTVQLLVLEGGAGAWVLSILETASAGDALVIDAGPRELRLAGSGVSVASGASYSLRASAVTVETPSLSEVVGQKSTCCEGTQIMHAGMLMIDAERHVSVHAPLATVTADSLLKMDAAQIHMG